MEGIPEGYSKGFLYQDTRNIDRFTYPVLWLACMRNGDAELREAVTPSHKALGRFSTRNSKAY